MTNYLASKSYLAIKVEAAENTPIKPDVFIPLINEGKLRNFEVLAFPPTPDLAAPCKMSS